MLKITLLMLISIFSWTRTHRKLSVASWRLVLQMASEFSPWCLHGHCCCHMCEQTRFVSEPCVILTVFLIVIMSFRIICTTFCHVVWRRVWRHRWSCLQWMFRSKEKLFYCAQNRTLPPKQQQKSTTNLQFIFFKMQPSSLI